MKSRVQYLLFATIVAVQIAVILYVAVGIFRMKKYAPVVFSPIDKGTTAQNPESQLKYFYEPKSLSYEVVNPWMQSKAVYTINSDTLNERYEYRLDKPAGVYRIVTLGDSYTYGLYVDTKDNWTERLEDLLNNEKCRNIRRFEVINLGVHGYDMEDEAERFRLRGKKYKPDMVLWLVEEGDKYQLNEVMLKKEKEYSEAMKRTGEFERLVKAGNPYPSYSKALEDTISELGGEYLLEYQGTILKTFRNEYEGDLMMATFPSTDKRFRDALKNALAASKSKSALYDKLVDINNTPAYIFPNDGHPTVVGHKAIAEDFLKELLSSDFITCKQ